MRGARRPVGWPDDFLRPAALRPATPALPPPRARLPFWLELAETLLLALVLFVVVRLVVQNFQVDGLSMAPTLQPGQFLLVNKVAYATVDEGLARWWPGRLECKDGRCFLFRAPRRCDIVVFWPPALSTKPFIKRVIGLPGERVEIREGQVWIDDVPLDEPYIRARPNYDAPAAVVPPGQYYLLGDNRNNSSDSHLFGELSSEHFIGQAWLTYWPSDLWGVVPTPTYAAQPAGP
jgi:signal peptidase I